jgi:hypothetical protein
MQRSSAAVSLDERRQTRSRCDALGFQGSHYGLNGGGLAPHWPWAIEFVGLECERRKGRTTSQVLADAR